MKNCVKGCSIREAENHCLKVVSTTSYLFLNIKASVLVINKMYVV